jgi:hypothetical protein
MSEKNGKRPSYEQISDVPEGQWLGGACGTMWFRREGAYLIRMRSGELFPGLLVFEAEIGTEFDGGKIATVGKRMVVLTDSVIEAQDVVAEEAKQQIEEIEGRMEERPKTGVLEVPRRGVRLN